jgi:hypothetical protein
MIYLIDSKWKKNFTFLKTFQRPNPMSKCKNQSVWYIFDYDNCAYEWTLHIWKDNGVMVDIWLLIKSKDNL